ncbi:MAG: energy-coupling factor transporter ATPase [Tissierellales bacterium]|jgi:energy-coupling factor transport system ATP-binding protein|nr:energy-coupling factor transporter ATPase [Tissierellales bacterium]
MKKIIEIKNLTYEYKNDEEIDVAAVDNVTLDIYEGEFLVVLGHNGSGKSTLAKQINALSLPTRGDVIVKGMNTKDSEEIWNIRKTAGMVFQNPDNQLVATIVEEDVAFGPENLGIEPEEIRKIVDKSLKTVEMLEYKEHAPHMLSGGQKQRIAIAGVLAIDPEIIILDEPTAMLDPVGRKEVIDTIIKLNREKNKTIVHITHYMDEAVNADRIVIMEKGKVIKIGTPKEIFSDVERMKAIGLDIPQVTELVYELNKTGFKLDPEILTIEELVKAI